MTNTINYVKTAKAYKNGLESWETFNKVPHKEEWAKPILKACEKAYKSLTFYAKYYGVNKETAQKYYGYCTEHLAEVQKLAGLPTDNASVAMLFALFGIRQGKIPKTDTYTLKPTTLPTLYIKV